MPVCVADRHFLFCRDMYPSIELFGKTIGLYSVCAIIGMAAAVVFFIVRRSGTGLEGFDIPIFALSVGAGLLVGGHLLYGITNYSLLLRTLSAVGRISTGTFFSALGVIFGGSVFYGGMIGSVIGMEIYMKARKLLPDRKSAIRDVYACAIPLFHAFGRVGCFLGGCCYGIESSFGFIVHGNEYSPEINDVRRFPTPLLESALNVCLFIFLLILLRRGKFRGSLLLVYGVTYPVIRFFDEFLRGDEIRGFIWKLSTSQWISVVIFIISLVLLIVKARRPENAPEAAPATAPETLTET